MDLLSLGTFPLAEQTHSPKGTGTFFGVLSNWQSNTGPAEKYASLQPAKFIARLVRFAALNDSIGFVAFWGAEFGRKLCTIR